MTDDLLSAVDDGRFAELFIRKLGWNAPTHGALRVDDGFGNTFEVAQVASYRGMGIWACASIPSLDSQRLIDSEVAKKTLERLIIYTDGDRQEWRWPRSTRRGKSGPPTLVPHRHTVGQPNPSLVERLELIRIPVDGQMTVPELLDLMREAFDREAETASKQAARLMGSLYERLEIAGMGEQESSIFLARMLFLMFGDDTGMWKKSLFHDFLAESTKADGSDLRQRLSEAFEAANTAERLRRSDLPKALEALPYINGGVFAEELRMPELDGAFRKALMEACRFDWGQISPAVFGSMFQTVKSKEARRHLGEHYTTEENILKTIEPLFLDDLREKLDAAWDDRKALAKLHRELGEMRFLDPACGCGNFLIVAYRELRALELALLIRQRDLAAEAGDRKAMQLAVDATQSLKVSIEQFYGIEIEAWPARIAETAMFLVDHQANLRMDHELGIAPTRLPLEVSPHILHADALSTSWASLLPPSDTVIIFGNPPFAGHTTRSAVQSKQMKELWGSRYSKWLDFVTCWYLKAADYAVGTKARIAFVSTNSISQGEQVARLWSGLLDAGFEITFAHRPFKWTSEAYGAATLHVVIEGLSWKPTSTMRRLFSYSSYTSAPSESHPRNISPYLLDGPNVLVQGRRTPLSQSMPAVRYGSLLSDGGALIVSTSELPLDDEIAMQYIRPMVGGQELLHGEERWVIWMPDGPKSGDLRASSFLRERLERCREFRENSKNPDTRDLASTPHRFFHVAQPSAPYLGIPATVSEHRRWYTVARLPSTVIAPNSLYTAEDPSGFLFGVLSSTMFMVWQRYAAGQLESRLRFSASVVNNTFPLPDDLSQEQRKAVIAAGAAVQEARGDGALADIYEDAKLTPLLIDAHEKLDEIVDAIFGLESGGSNEARMAVLLERYSACSGGEA